MCTLNCQALAPRRLQWNAASGEPAANWAERTESLQYQGICLELRLFPLQRRGRDSETDWGSKAWCLTQPWLGLYCSWSKLCSQTPFLIFQVTCQGRKWDTTCLDQKQKRLQMKIMSFLLQRRETNTEDILVYQQNSALPIQPSVNADNHAISGL